MIASIGTYSGPGGGVIKPFVDGVQVWVKWINARGGLKGRQVKYVWADDNMDPARNRALYQDMVENKGAIAFVANGDPFGGRASIEYVNKKRIPVVGGICGSDWFYESAMYFPYCPEGVMNWAAAISGAADYFLPKGLKKFGSMTCAEAPTCQSADKLWHENGRAKQVGFDPVYRSQISIAQPDFTAECLGAQRAGVQVLAVLGDVATVHRVAASCARQGFKPKLFWPYTAHLPNDKDDPNFDGGLMSAGWFPAEVPGDTPATGEYVDAFRKFLGGDRASGHSGGWAAAKVFERAALSGPDPGSSAGILDGLWTAFNGETLGGLTMPLTFVREKPAAKAACWTNVVIDKGKYVLADKGQFKCAA